jgi:hypothetical protein
MYLLTAGQVPSSEMPRPAEQRADAGRLQKTLP